MDQVNSATGDPAQDIVSQIEDAIYPESEEIELEENLEDEASEDGEVLPEDDDSESEEDEGSAEDEIVDEDLSLSALLGIEEDRISLDKDGNVVISAKIDGESKAVNLKDMVASYQLMGHVNNKSMAVEAERKEFEQQREVVTNEIEKRLLAATKFSAMAKDHLMSDYNSIDWDALRRSDPAEWTALQHEFSQKAQFLKNAEQEISTELQKSQNEKLEKQNIAFSNHTKAEFAKMLANNPSWQDPSVRAREVAGIKSFLSTQYGFSPSDMNAVSDSRLISLIQDARSYREGKQEAQKKVVKKVPTYKKPVASRAQIAAAQTARNAKALKQAAKSGNTRDIAALIESRM